MSGPPARAPWAERRVAVVGLGALGRACASALHEAPGLRLAAIVRRRASLDGPLPEGVPANVPLCEAGALRDVDAALVCVPKERTLDTVRQLLSRGVPIVECARLHALAFAEQRAAIDREALRHRCAALVGAGWDPGALPLLRGWLALLVPRGRTELRQRAAASLHHTGAAREVVGVRDALCTERRASDGRVRRYVYVELEPGADAERVGERLRSDPLFLGEETVVVPVESLAALAEEDEGVLLERWGAAGVTAHQRLLFEARCHAAALAAQVMVAAARALAFLPPGAHTLLEVPPVQLFGEVSPAARDARP
jgi:diaminopimelate dehydrogenase